ncbi:hypothetical protein OUZ56_013210 [Daphnia magna]|uniref:Uncharacterized protein n=1 Tax=Daphnia magna TaxID=35525 RepID=A0ABQ9Z585_9CRUS|nr:hypothetical protein OUZ56_013210 [Daphnia magna]
MARARKCENDVELGGANSALSNFHDVTAHQSRGSPILQRTDAKQQQVSGCVNDVSCDACVPYVCVNKKLVI